MKVATSVASRALVEAPPCSTGLTQIGGQRKRGSDGVLSTHPRTPIEVEMPLSCHLVEELFLLSKFGNSPLENCNRHWELVKRGWRGSARSRPDSTYLDEVDLARCEKVNSKRVARIAI